MMEVDNLIFDIERMRMALEGPKFTMLKGLSRNEKREYIIKVACGEIEPNEVNRDQTNLPTTKPTNPQ